jgi:hypothetical protein
VSSELSWTRTLAPFGAVESSRTTHEIGPPPPVSAVEKSGGNLPTSLELKWILCGSGASSRLRSPEQPGVTELTRSKVIQQRHACATFRAGEFVMAEIVPTAENLVLMYGIH